MRSPERPSKQEAFLALLREGWASLHLDARRPGVVVPAHLRAEAHLVLQYGHDLPIPIPDLEIDEHGVGATLSFSKSPQRTVVPWSAVYVVACDDGRAILYQEDVPEDVSIIAARTSGEDGAVEDVAGDIASDAAGDAADFTGPRRSARAVAGTSGSSGRISERLLRSVPDEGDPEAAGDLPQVGSGARRRRKPQLRLVK
jgi:stringent starvation protein B